MLPATPFTLSLAQQQFGAEVKALAREVLAPIARAGQPRRVNRPLVRALGEHGVFGRLFPDVPSGEPRQLSALTLSLLKESLAQISTEAEDALGLQGLGYYPILRWGSEAVVRRWHGPVVRGEAVAAFAMTEPEAGSDVAALQLRAERAGDGYRLNGSKIWISNAPDADLYTVFARTTPDAGARGVTAFAVPGDSPGLGGQPLDLIVSHPVGRLEFDNVYVPADHVVGELNKGFAIGMQTLDLFRISIGAFAVGMAQAAVEAAIAQAGQRRAFGAPLRDFQGVSHKLADMVTRTEAARLLIYHAASLYDADASGISRVAAMAKLNATETAQWVVDSALQIHGAAALEEGHLLGHLYREVRAPRIYEGTSEVLRTLIARELCR